MSPGATFDRVYAALKEQLGERRFRPGDQLEPRVLAEDLVSSSTPVRDALHRLMGEGLIEAARHDGFRVPFVTEAGLRHLIDWHSQLVGLALRRAAPAGPTPGESDDRPASAVDLFVRIAAAARNPEHEAAIARLQERLRPARAVEPQILSGLGEELEALASAVAAGERKALARLVAAYHRRRHRAAAEFVAALHGAA